MRRQPTPGFIAVGHLHHAGGPRRANALARSPWAVAALMALSPPVHAATETLAHERAALIKISQQQIQTLKSEKERSDWQRVLACAEAADTPSKLQSCRRIFFDNSSRRISAISRIP